MANATASRFKRTGYNMVDAPGSQLPFTGASTTANRPIIDGPNQAAFVYPGMPWFDTSLNKPIWVRADGTLWIDATGAVV